MFGDIEEKKPVTISEAKEILKEVKRQNYVQKQALEYATKFSKLSVTKSKKLIDELLEAGIPRIKDRHLVKLADLMPHTHDEMRAIFAKEEITLTKQDLDKVLEILKKYR